MQVNNEITIDLHPSEIKRLGEGREVKYEHVSRSLILVVKIKLSLDAGPG